MLNVLIFVNITVYANLNLQNKNLELELSGPTLQTFLRFMMHLPNFQRLCHSVRLNTFSRGYFIHVLTTAVFHVFSPISLPSPALPLEPSPAHSSTWLSRVP